MRHYQKEYRGVDDGLDDYFGTGKIDVEMSHHDESFCFKYVRKWQSNGYNRKEGTTEEFYISPDEVVHFVKYMLETDELCADNALKQIKELLK